MAVLIGPLRGGATGGVASAGVGAELEQHARELSAGTFRTVVGRAHFDVDRQMQRRDAR